MKTLKIAAGLLLSILSISAMNAQSNSASKTETIALQGAQLFPEGIITLPNNDLLIGGFGDGPIQKIDSKNKVSYFSKSGENGMVIAVGMALDVKNNRLWVANFNFKTESGNPGSNMKVFDYTTGKLLKTIPETFIQGAFFNEVALDASGRVYVSNTFGPTVYSTTFESTNTDVFATSDLLKNPAADQPFGQNGLTITPDKKYLLVSVMNRTIKGGGTLVRVDLATKEVKSVKLKDDEATKAFSGSDGMFFYKDQLMMVNVYSQSGAIFSAKFNADYSEASLTIRNKFQSVYDRPTASAIRNGKLYTVNSQLNHIIDDKDGKINTPPVLPFNVVSVPLAELLK
jgi:hypothetical protein